jgi:hypothetical protein
MNYALRSLSKWWSGIVSVSSVAAGAELAELQGLPLVGKVLPTPHWVIGGNSAGHEMENFVADYLKFDGCGKFWIWGEVYGKPTKLVSCHKSRPIIS